MPAELAPGPLFLVGTWRSGTSLAYALLNQHSEIALMYEPDLFALEPMSILYGRSEYWSRRWNFWNSALDRHQVSIDRALLGSPHFSSTAQQIYRQYALEKHATIWGEKSPNYFDRLVHLSKRCRNARFLIIWRNPKDICRSIAQASRVEPWFARKGMISRALFGYRTLRQQCDLLRKRRVPLHELHYESLVQDPELTMRGVCTFLQIPFDARMASLEGSDHTPIYEGEHHTLVKGQRIVPAKAEEPPLPAPLARKIDRYLSFWRDESRGEWPVHLPSAYDKAGKPSMWERISDRANYITLRAADRFTVWIYCFAPLRVLRAYRHSKQGFQPKKTTEESGALLP